MTLSKNISKFCSESFHDYTGTPIHVLCSNFTEIVRREVGETMRCFANKNSSQNEFFGTILRPFSEGAKAYRERVTWPYFSLHNFVPIGSDLPELFPKK